MPFSIPVSKKKYDKKGKVGYKKNMHTIVIIKNKTENKCENNIKKGIGTLGLQMNYE